MVTPALEIFQSKIIFHDIGKKTRIFKSIV